MIFRQYEQVINGTKTQTRRVKKGRETLCHVTDYIGVRLAVMGDNGNIKHYCGQSYSIIPKRGMKSVGRFEIVTVREEPLHSITEEDARAEGVANIAAYRELWEAINGKYKGCRWEDNPVVFVYTIRALK